MQGVRLAVCFGAALALFSVSQAEAQYPGTPQDRYMGGPQWLQRPTISPWLDLYREDGGVVDNYHQFVRPKFRMQKYLLQQDRQAHQQRVQMRQMQQNQQRQQDELENLQNPQQIPLPEREGFKSQTGIGAGFMSYGGFMTHHGYFGRGTR